MLQAFTMTFREGLGAFLVVAVMLAFFRCVEAEQLRAAVRRSMVFSVLTSALAAILFSQAANQALWEGVLAIGSAACVAALGLYLRSLWRQPRQTSAIVSVTMYLITVLMITRGGMEIALLMGTMIALVPASEVLFGAALGTVLAVAVSWLWARAARFVPQRLLGQLTAIFLTVFFLQLLVDGVHELAESNVFPYTRGLHRATQAFSSEGVYGQHGQYLLIAAPTAWWLVAIFWGHGKAAAGRVAHMGR